MNLTTVMGFVAGALQFIVAGYALRLNRLFGTRRVGWSLFWAFLLLALLHLMQSVMKGGFGAEIGVKVDVMNALISMLLLIGMVHLEGLLKERMRVESEEQRMRVELQAEVKKKTSYLMRAIEQLQAEMEERKRVEGEAQSARWELSAVSRQAEMAQIASKVLQSVGDMLKSVNMSADMVSDQVKQSKIANVVRVGVMIRENGANLGEFMVRDPRGQKLPVYIAQLAEHLSMEQSGLLTQLEFIKDNLQKITLMQQDYCKLAGQARKVNDDPATPDEPRDTEPVTAV
ncbi:MAG TPA: hypothetical protein VMF08_14445 [Candidatus Sulfotelmatobacter sp.]|nr:hypothetical protein [Candidatus Sulfotelmatobacter sp.]